MYLSRVIFTRRVTPKFPEKNRSAVAQNGVWDSHQPSCSRGYVETPSGSSWQSDIERAAEEGYMEKEGAIHHGGREGKKGQHNSPTHPDNTSPNAAAQCAI